MRDITYEQLKEKFLVDIGFDYKNPNNRSIHEDKLLQIRRSCDFSIGDYIFKFKKEEESPRSGSVFFIYSMHKNTSDWVYGDVLICWVGENNSYDEKEIHGYIDNFDFVKPEMTEVHKILGSHNMVPKMTAMTAQPTGIQYDDDISKLQKILVSQNVDENLIKNLRARICSQSTMSFDEIVISKVVLSKNKDRLSLKITTPDKHDSPTKIYGVTFKKNPDESWTQSTERILDPLTTY